MPSVLGIIINYSIEKKNVLLKIEKLLTPYGRKNEFITYQTNYNNIAEINKFTFSDYFTISSSQNIDLRCLFKNNNQDNLLLLCEANTEGIFKLGKVQGEFNDINIFYNFKIENSENNEEFNISGTGAKIYSVSPKEINFDKSEIFTIIYNTDYPKELKGIKLNPNSQNELICEDKIGYKLCNITQDHFESSGHYYTHHSLNNDKNSISYEVSPIMVTIKGETPAPTDEPENYDVIIAVSVVGGVIIIALVIFLIWFYLRKKKEKENLNNLNEPISSQINEEINNTNIEDSNLK